MTRQLSTTEAEYVSAASCCSQILSVRNQLEDYSLRYTSVPIYCDNTSAINLSKNPIQHSRSKHIEIKHHFISDHVQKKNIALSFVDTENQLADIFTKPLVVDRFNFFKEKLLIMKNPNKDWLLITKGLRLNPLISSDANQIDLSQSEHSSECSWNQNVPQVRMFIKVRMFKT